MYNDFGDFMECNKLAKAVTKAGVLLLESGAETYRVEDTMRRICYHYGASVVDSYATPTLIIISFSYQDELVHNVKRTQMKSIDLHKVDLVNNLSRVIASENLSIDDLLKELEKIEHSETYSLALKVLASGACTFGFAFFFHGTLLDAIAAFFNGALLQLFLYWLNSLGLDSFFKNVSGGAFVTFFAFIAYRCGLAHSLDTVVISTLMLLVPGLAITNAMRDTVSGDLISGTSRIMESLIIAVAIAVGSGLVFALIGGL